jgi:hypothetical protein
MPGSTLGDVGVLDAIRRLFRSSPPHPAAVAEGKRLAYQRETIRISQAGLRQQPGGIPSIPTLPPTPDVLDPDGRR